MGLTKLYITNGIGRLCRCIEEILLDRGLFNAMKEIDGEETVEYEQAEEFIRLL